MATVCRPPSASGVTAAFARATIVSGPGQNAAAARRSRSVKLATSIACSRVAATSGTGLRASRPFNANSRSTASCRRGSTASPYNVSVGNATTPPARSASTAAATAVVSGRLASTMIRTNSHLFRRGRRRTHHRRDDHQPRHHYGQHRKADRVEDEHSADARCPENAIDDWTQREAGERGRRQ